MSKRRNVQKINKGEKVVINVSERPRFSGFELKLLHLNKIPFVRDFSWVHKLLCNIYHIPFSSNFSKDFSLLQPILEVGENTGLNDTFMTGSGLIKIGNYCSFSFRNMIFSSAHDTNDFSKLIIKPVTIGDNVWVTSNVIILGGVTIGNNTIIGAGSVVTHDIPSGVFAAGNPCKVIKQINFKK